MDSRSAAQELVALGRVTVNGAAASKPARLVDPGDAIEVYGEPDKYVGRGADKMVGAIEAFGINPTGLRVIDVGASTGGFTDCVLQAGAAEVVAIDVGRAQLHERLVADPRVHNLERTNVRHVEVSDIGGAAPLVVGDLSFISLRTVMAKLAELTAAGGRAMMLVKPQFEAGRQEVSRGRGVIKDPEIWRRVLEEVTASAAAHGLHPVGLVPSPITGGEGNVEFLLLMERGEPTHGGPEGSSGTPAAPVDIADAVEAAQELAGS